VERELALIDNLHLAGYSLIVWTSCNFCRAKGISRKRGSAANSAGLLLARLTAVDAVA